DAMYIHVIDHCKDISQPDRFKFIELQAKKTTTSRIKSKSIDNNDQDSEDTLSVLKKLKTSNLTLIFDDWTTISNSSVYAFFAITSYGDIHMLGLEEFEDQRHTSENIANITIEAINKIGLNMEQFNHEIIQIIEDRNHWKNNELLMKILEPVNNAIKQLETANTTLADAYLLLINLGKNLISLFTNINKYDFKLYIYLCTLAIFCHSKTQKFAISKKTTLSDIQTTAIKLIKKWNWNRELAVDIKNGLADYLNFIGDFNLDKGILIDNPRIYWDHILNLKYAALIIFVKRIFSFVPYAAEAERYSEEIYNIDDWDDNINDTLTSIELKNELETFFEEEQAELEDITNLIPKFIIEQLVDINDPIFYNQTVLNNFIDESLVMDENNDSDWDINSIIDD
ncbi:16376_t:CDS:2, partial [Racocetra fulgida]